MITTPARLDLFGGQRPWSPVDWTASDDRVRGGQSQSYMECTPFDNVARFHGSLDIDTLGGAGFASQRTTSDVQVWDLSEYSGIMLDIAVADSKTYTLTLKDELLPVNPENNREQATISWEYGFSIERAQQDEKPKSTEIRVPWNAFKATYRGKERKDASPLKVKNIRRYSLLMRSYFGEQQGPFSLSISSISAYRDKNAEDEGKASQDLSPRAYSNSTKEHAAQGKPHGKEVGPQGWLGRLFQTCISSVRLA